MSTLKTLADNARSVFDERTSLVLVSLVTLVVTIVFGARRSGMPSVFGRYSSEGFVLLILLTAFSLSMGIVALVAPLLVKRFVTRLFLRFAVGLALAELLAYVFAPVLPHEAWLRLPYQIKKRTYATRPETIQVRQNTIVEENFWAFEPYQCSDWPLLFGPDLIDVNYLPTFEVCHDEIGFRNPIGTYTASATADVIILGDSFTYGFGSRRSWPDHLRNKSGLTVLNLAQTGGSVPRWIGAFRRYGVARTPAVVIAATWDALNFTGLESSDHVHDSQRQIEQMMGVVSEAQGDNPFQRIVDYSLSFSVLNRAVISTATNRAAGQGQVMGLSLDDGTEVRLWTNRRPDYADSTRWELYEQRLIELNSLAEANGSSLILVYFTTASVIYAPYEVIPTGAVLADVDNNRKISERLRSTAAAHGIWYLDTTPGLQDLAGHSPLLYSWDGHFTQEGYDAIADGIYEFLIEESLLEGK